MFYIKPPLGQISLHILEKIVFTRLEYLKHLQENGMNDFNGHFEYLIENSLYDKIGHFMLRLLACTSIEFQQYWMNKETLLLRHRLNNASTRQLHRLLRNILRDLKKSNKKNKIDNDVNKICTFYLQPLVFQHLKSKFCTKDCDSFYSEVSFKSVINMIKTRDVDLTGGNAIVYCWQYTTILESLFHTFINEEMKQATDNAKFTVAVDPRMYLLNEKIHFLLLKRNSQCGRITFENINTESQMFPLCMKHLHLLLQKRHRLSHYARFYYSLFLKECGMSINDSILYWKSEYLKPHACTSSCMHDWQSNEKKFMYSIRHLYGLEGSRKNYKCPGCNVICDETPGIMYEGGCPFKNFDRQKLEGLLENSLGKDKGKLFSKMVLTLKPETACGKFFQTVYQSEENVVIHNPVQYYLSALKAV